MWPNQRSRGFHPLAKLRVVLLVWYRQRLSLSLSRAIIGWGSRLLWRTHPQLNWLGHLNGTSCS